MKWHELAARRFKRRFLGTSYCTIENLSTHDYAVDHRLDDCCVFLCRKCGHRAFIFPGLGLIAA
ncbi:hypothetical protein DFS21_11093 [Pseudomonas sp. 2848]|uniref:hypothetical protein n=1 Tax=Pseudomonas sp. 2848 TaxID=2183926 RepID=UPI000DAE1561|nr:hypothetical protein [Pseudomonas sp. 2848]PZW76641.1 hypothetical protein DFS21_11093 [Pseudomonas sp. 2848]